MSKYTVGWTSKDWDEFRGRQRELKEDAVAASLACMRECDTVISFQFNVQDEETYVDQIQKAQRWNNNRMAD